MMALNATCPICGVQIPLPHKDTADERGLSIELDVTLVNEHGRMHTRCTCLWQQGTRRHNPTCPVHAP